METHLIWHRRLQFVCNNQRMVSALKDTLHLELRELQHILWIPWKRAVRGEEKHALTYSAVYIHTARHYPIPASTTNLTLSIALPRMLPQTGHTRWETIMKRKSNVLYLFCWRRAQTNKRESIEKAELQRGLSHLNYLTHIGNIIAQIMGSRANNL